MPRIIDFKNILHQNTAGDKELDTFKRGRLQGRAVVCWWQACDFRKASKTAKGRHAVSEANRKRTTLAIKALHMAPELFRIHRPRMGSPFALVRFVSKKHQRTGEHDAMHLHVDSLAQAGLLKRMEGV